MYVNRPYWSDAAFEKYIVFMDTGFEAWTGVGMDVRIKINTNRVRRLEKWEADWQLYFSDDSSDSTVIKSTYNQLMKAFSEQFGYVQD